MTTFKKQLKQFFCVHIWKETRVDTLKKTVSHPMDDIMVTYLVAKKCYKCGKMELITKTVREEPNWLKQANREMELYRSAH